MFFRRPFRDALFAAKIRRRLLPRKWSCWSWRSCINLHFVVRKFTNKTVAVFIVHINNSIRTVTVWYPYQNRLQRWFSTAGTRPGTGTCRPFHWDLQHYRNWKCIRKCIKIKYFSIKKDTKKNATGTIDQKINIYRDK